MLNLNSDTADAYAYILLILIQKKKEFLRASSVVG